MWTILFLYGFSLGLAQTVVSQLAYYVLDENAALFLPLLIYSSISFGCMVGLHRRFEVWSDSAFLMLVGICLLATVLGFNFLPLFGGPILFLGFLGSGIYLTTIFARYRLKTIVWALGGGFLFSFALLSPLYSFLGSKIILATVLLPFIGSLVCKARNIAKIYSLCGVLIAIIIFYVVGMVPPVSYIHRRSPGLMGAQKAIPTLFDSLLLTDLLWAPRRNGHVIITNGRRFSQVVRSQDLEYAEDPNHLLGTFDPPYLLNHMKKVLIIGPAGGMNVLTAFKHGAEEVWGVDVNQSVFTLMKSLVAKESNRLYFAPNFIPVVQEGRNFIETTQEKFDLIVLQGVQTGSRSNAVNPVVLESFLMTEESLARMWTLLKPNGIIFFEEYRTYPTDRWEPLSLLATVGVGAVKTLGLDPFTQVAFFEFLNEVDNVGVSYRRKRQFREALILSRSDISKKIPEMMNRLARGTEDETRDLQLKLKDLPSKLEDSRSTITDNNPRFLLYSVLEKKPWAIMLGVLLLLLVTIGNFFGNSRSKQAWKKQTYFFMGIGYSCFLVAVVGYSTLLLGPPEMTTPFVFGVLFLSAILGGLFAMRSPYKVGWILTVLLIALLLVWPLMVFYLKPLLLPQSVFLIRSLVLGCVVGLTAFLTEIPYIMGLRELKGKDRTQLFVFGKIGSAVGIYMGLCATLYFGFSGGFYLASVSYLAVFFCICVIRFGEVSFLSGRGENY